MHDLDPEGLEARSVGAKKRKRTGYSTPKGPSFVHSLDGHDKLMGVSKEHLPSSHIRLHRKSKTFVAPHPIE